MSKYEIRWRNPEKKVLEVKYIEDFEWQDAIEANTVVAKMVREVSNDVIVFYDLSEHTPSNYGISSIKESLYSNGSDPNSIPENMKFTIVFTKNTFAAKNVKIAMEVLDKTIRHKKVNHFVTNIEEAEELIRKAGF
jgi:hypothetical protein